MENAPAIEAAHAVDRRQLVDDTGGEEELACRERRPVGERHREVLLLARRTDHLPVAQLNRVVAGELFAPEAAQLGGGRAIAGQVAMQVARRRVARPAGVDDQHATTAAAQDGAALSPAGPAPTMMTSCMNGLGELTWDQVGAKTPRAAGEHEQLAAAGRGTLPGGAGFVNVGIRNGFCPVEILGEVMQGPGKADSL